MLVRESRAALKPGSREPAGEKQVDCAGGLFAVLELLDVNPRGKKIKVCRKP